MLGTAESSLLQRVTLPRSMLTRTKPSASCKAGREAAAGCRVPHCTPGNYQLQARPRGGITMSHQSPWPVLLYDTEGVICSAHLGTTWPSLSGCPGPGTDIACTVSRNWERTFQYSLDCCRHPALDLSASRPLALLSRTGATSARHGPTFEYTETVPVPLDRHTKGCLLPTSLCTAPGLGTGRHKPSRSWCSSGGILAATEPASTLPTIGSKQKTLSQAHNLS